MTYLVPQTPWLRPGSSFDPYNGFFSSMPSEIDHFFDEFGRFSAPKAYGSEYAGVAPRMSVSETDNWVEIEAELPGVDEKDVEVMLNDDVITIKGQKKFEHEESKKDYYYCQERTFGKFVRSFTLPFTPDPKAVKTYFTKGVLNITVPKPVGVAKMVKIPVKAID
jgi:HSP20 family protein